MPVQLNQYAHMVHGDHVSIQLSKTISQLVGIVPAPPHQPNIQVVMANVLAAIEKAVQLTPALKPFVREFQTQLSLGIQEFSEKAMPTGREQMLGSISTFPAWSLLSTHNLFEQAGVDLTVGCQISIALLTGQVTPKRVFDDVRRAIGSSINSGPDDRSGIQSLEKIQRRSLRALQQVVSQRAHTSSTTLLSFNTGVIAHLRSTLSPHKATERQAAGRKNELPQTELQQSVHALVVQIGQDNLHSLCIALAFSIGLPWDIATRIPFLSGEHHPECMAWIDPLAGWVYIDLAWVLAELGLRSSERQIPTTSVLRRPLPLLLANALCEAVVANPMFSKVSDLGVMKTRNRSPIQFKDLQASATVARLIASRASAALRAGTQRHVAAFSTLSFFLICKSDFHYTTPAEKEIWEACERTYQSLGFGPAVPQHGINAGFVGSHRTPEASWLAEIFLALRDQVERIKVGKKYVLRTLIEHHNAYAIYTGMLMQLMAGGRNRKVIAFGADTWYPGSPFGLSFDKPLGPTEGVTPVPISSVLNSQIALWNAHIRALSNRLQKCLGEQVRPTIDHIEKIHARQRVAVLFVLSPSGQSAELTSKMMFAGEAGDLTRDFGRHFLVDQIAQITGKFSDGQNWLRHSVDGATSHSALGTTVHDVWLSRTAVAIDRAALALGIRPLAGLSKEGA